MWYQIVSACVNVGMAMQGQWMSNRINKNLYKTAAKTAEIKGKMAEANLVRRSGYRNEELGQAVWNTGANAQTLMGSQRAAMGASGFDISTGDQRILEDTLRRNLEEQKGMNRTAYLQQYEDDLQTRSDILQYNFEAYANRTIAKQYSGASGLAKIIGAGGSAFLSSALSDMLANPKGGISSNTGAGSGGTSWMSDASARAKQAGSSGFGSSSALGNFGSFSSGNKLDLGMKF